MSGIYALPAVGTADRGREPALQAALDACPAQGDVRGPSYGDPLDMLTGTTLEGRYTLLGLLGEGGMAVV